MSIVNSVLFGAAGTHNCLGTKITFEKKADPHAFNHVERSLFVRCMSDYDLLFHQKYLHLLVHAAGKAAAIRLLTNQKPEIVIYTNRSASYVSLIKDHPTLSPWKLTMIDVSGIFCNMEFSALKIIVPMVMARALNQIPASRNFAFDVPFTLFAGALVAGGLLNIQREVTSAYQSASQKDMLAFGRVAKRSKVPLYLASTLLAMQVACCVLVAARMFTQQHSK